MSILLALLLLLPAVSQTPSPGKTAVAPQAAQRPAPDTAAARAAEILDSLARLPLPRGLSAADARAWHEQTEWLKSLGARVRSLMALVLTPAEKVAPPAPISTKNVKALQEEAETEAAKFSLTAPALRSRHETAMNAIRNMK